MEKSDIINSLLDKAKKQGADEVDVILIDSSSLSTEVRLAKPVTIDRAEDSSLGLRILVDKRQAIVSTEDLSDDSLNKLVERGIAMAKVTPRNSHLGLASKEQIAHSIIDLDLYDPVEPSMEQLIDSAKEAEAYALENKQIKNSEGASAHYQASQIIFASSNGFEGSYKGSSTSVAVSVLAGESNNMQTGSDFSVSRHREDLKSVAAIGREAAQNAIEKLNPRKLATDEMEVIFDAKVAKRLLAAFASAINGSAISRGTSFLLNSMGEEIFNSNITIIDDPLIKRGIGSRPFDGEGIQGEKLTLVENKIFTEYFLDIHTANKLKLKTNARAARSIAGAPHPSLTNLIMLPGKNSTSELIKSIKKGILVKEIIGHGANIVTGEYSQGVNGFYIENGEILYPVSEITIASNLKHMFKTMIAGDDLKIESNINCPSLHIERMTVAGV